MRFDLLHPNVGNWNRELAPVCCVLAMLPLSPGRAERHGFPSSSRLSHRAASDGSYEYFLHCGDLRI
jgi:hypothetical protein